MTVWQIFLVSIGSEVFMILYKWTILLSQFGLNLDSFDIFNLVGTKRAVFPSLIDVPTIDLINLCYEILFH